MTATRHSTGAPLTIWVDRWFASSAATFLELLRAANPDSTLLYTHHEPTRGAMRGADLCLPGPEDHVEAVVAFAVEHGVDVWIPARNQSMAVIAEPVMRELGVAVTIPSTDPGVIAAIRDKHLTYQACDDHELAATPRWVTATGVTELAEAVAFWIDRGSACCVKPVIGEGAVGFRIIDPAHSARAAFTGWPSPVMSPDEFFWHLSRLDTGLGAVLVSDVLPGDETSVDVASVDGEIAVAVSRRKLSATLQRIDHRPDLEAVVARLAAHWRLHGCWNAQFKTASDGIDRILELNPRPAAGSLHSAAFGANFPALAVSIARGGRVGTVAVPDGLSLERSEVTSLITR